jgi:hypothetical protein
VCDTARDAPLEETWQLPVAVPSALNPYSLADLIAHYGGVEKDVNVHCKTCGVNTPHDSRPSYLQTPRILVIQALRFVVPKSPPEITAIRDSTPGNESQATDSDTTTKRGKRRPKRNVVKNPAHITFPLTSLDMTSYLREQHGAEMSEEYDLFAVVEHVGRRMDGGHYIAYVRGRDALGKDQWWKCNDAKCWVVSGDVVSTAQGYIWFYERRARRGVDPEGWGDVIPMDEQTSKEIPLVDGDVEPATPESDERPVVDERRTQSDTGARTRDIEASWEGRLRGTSDGSVNYFPSIRDGY